MPSLIVTCCVVFPLYCWEDCSFQKRNGGGIYGRGEEGEEGKSKEKGTCGHYVLYETINLKKKNMH